MSRLDLKLVALAVGSRKSSMPIMFSDSLVHVKIVTGAGITEGSTVCNGCADDKAFGCIDWDHDSPDRC